MLKLRKNKVLVALISIFMVVLVLGNIYSLATDEGSSSGALQLTSTNNTTNSNTAKNITSNTNSGDDLGAAVGATNQAGNNTSTNKSTNNTNVNASKNNTNSASSKLPYAGSNTSVVFILIALGASAVYAYKKVSDYNI